MQSCSRLMPDLRQRWINVVTFDVERDWSWRGLAEAGLTIERAMGPIRAPDSWQPIGTVRISSSVVEAAVPATEGARDTERQSCRVMFCDAVSPLEVGAADDFPTA